MEPNTKINVYEDRWGHLVGIGTKDKAFEAVVLYIGSYASRSPEIWRSWDKSPRYYVHTDKFMWRLA